MRRIAVITPTSHLKGINDLLESKGDVFYLENNPNKSKVKELIKNKKIDTIICNPNQQSFKIDKHLLENTKIKTINSCSTGLNHIDLDYCQSQNIEIQCHKNDYELINQLPSTSELAFGLMLSLLRNIPNCINHVSKYGWDYTQFMGRQVKDLKVGIIGYGRLGKMMEGYCKAFNAETFIYDPYVDSHQISLEQMFQICDVISLHVHVTDETKHMINKKLFGLVKKDLYLINTSRGEIVFEKDVVDALQENKLAGYGTDVVEDEFGDITTSPIIKAMNEGNNIIITPHIGGMTIEGQTKAYEWSIKKL
tara:strand:+ start:1562 stop:2485 length:924 start_codon:yes stop_codon:yes gene_type:complete